MVISPAKKMRIDTDSFPIRDLPMFLPQTELLLAKLRSMSYEELKTLWSCSDTLAKLNQERVKTMDLYHHLTPAILAYEGIQYQYMAPGVFTAEALNYVQENLRILSGFYGCLRPFDGVTPYRLEMQTKLSIEGEKDLYGFWGARLAQQLFSETDCVIDLASKEYSLCISRYLPENAQWITCVFGEEKQGKIVEKGTMCKMARGEMVRYLAEIRAEEPEALKGFTGLGYHYAEYASKENQYVFIKEK